MQQKRSARAHIVWETMVLRRPKRSVECSDSEKNMSAFADQNHAPSLTCVRLEQKYPVQLFTKRCTSIRVALLVKEGFI